MCQTEAIIGRLRIPEAGPWRAAVVFINAELAKRAMADDRVTARTGGDINAMTLVLAEIGCLGCWDPPGFDAAVESARVGLTRLDLRG